MHGDVIKNFHDLYGLRHLFWVMGGLSVDDFARLCERSPATIRRWDREGSAPCWAVLLAGCAAGLLLHPDWHEFRVLPDGLLWDRVERRGYHAGHLRSIRWLKSALDSAQAENRELRRELDGRRFLSCAANDCGPCL